MDSSIFTSPRTDAKSDIDIGGDIQAIDLDVVAEIEKDIEACDLVSLVFLLYDSPDVALERLTIFLKVFKDLGEKYPFNLLQYWAKQNVSNPKWRYMFLEALTICQLYKVVRKLGFQVPIIKMKFLPKDLKANFYVNPMKKALYRLCEHVTKEIFQRLKSTLNTYSNIKIDSEKYFELIILELMCQRFIFVDSNEIDTNYDIENLAKIIDNFPRIRQFSDELREIQSRLTGLSFQSSLNNEKEKRDIKLQDKVTSQDLNEIWKMFDKLELEESSAYNLKSDTKKVFDMYTINNPKKVGVCHIINQVDFSLSEESIKNIKKSCINLESRLGSDKDKMVLEDTMQSLNFEVICNRNLGREKMIESIKEIIKYRVFMDHSMYILCILSHGVKDHVYAADSQLVNVQDIENIVETGLEERGLHGIPKVLIVQACQINNDETQQEEVFATDGPRYIIRKYHFLTCWATAPELEAFRAEKIGSIYIQTLCYFIKKYSKQMDMNEILTKVAKYVNKVCEIKRLDQVPTYRSTMTSKLYLQIPE